MESVSAARMKTVAAILRDPNPIHWDREATRALGLEGRLINQSPVNLGYITNMLMAWCGADCIRRLRVQFPRPVFDGDTVTAGGMVQSIEIVPDNPLESRDGLPERDPPGTRHAICEVWLDCADGNRAIRGSATVALPD